MLGYTRGPAVTESGRASTSWTWPLRHLRTNAAPDEALGKDGTVDPDETEGTSGLVDSVVDLLSVAVSGVPALALGVVELVEAVVQALTVAIMMMMSVIAIHGLTRD